MGNIAKYRKRKVALLTAAVVASAWMPTAFAMPETVIYEKNVEIPRNEDNTLKVEDKTLNIKVNSERGAIDWEKFNIANGETVKFTGSGKWMVLNRVPNGPKSEIYGNLFGQGGTVFLVNPNGILFGANACVDVGSLVASTMDIDRDEFLDPDPKKYPGLNKYPEELQDKIFELNSKGNAGITINKLANITARDGYVAILAHSIDNKGTITAPEVAMAAGKDVTLIYDNKINLIVNVLKDTTTTTKIATVGTNNNYVLMTAKDANDIIGDSIINNSGTIAAAKGIKKDADGKLILSGDGGNIVMTAAKVLVNGELSADAQEDGSKGGTITTAGYESLQVRDDAKVHAKSDAEAEAGTWNINAKNLVITDNKDNTGDTAKPNKVSNTALGEALNTTNVNVVVSPKKHDYYSDIVVEQAITKDGENATSLSLTAGRNVSVDANIKSDKGALNLTLNSNNTEKTNSTRADGASIIRADISTKGGSFTTTGEHGTYIGIKRDKTGGEPVGKERSITTEGGNITLGGDEVLVATGGEVTLDAGEQGNITIAGDVNSANAYYDGGNDTISWENARTNAKASGTGDLAGKTHLAVITGALEDAVATSAIAKDRNKDTEAYVGGHVVKVKVDAEGYPVDASGKRIKYTEDTNGNPVIIGVPVIDESCLDENGNVTVMKATDKTNKGENAKGWYKIVDADDSSKVRYAHFWAWTEGTEQERGKIFFVQTKGENILNKEMEGSTDADWSKEHGFAVTNASSNEPYYKNFAPNEPNDDKSQDGTYTQLALAINYDTHKNDMRSEILYSQWDDIGESKNKIAHYVVEADLGETALVAKGKNVEIDGAVGNLTPLSRVKVDAANEVTFKKSVNVTDYVSVLAKGDVGVNDISAGKIISLAGNDVTLGGTLKAKAENNEEAVKVVAQKKFINNAGAEVMQLGKGSRWKVYSETPYKDEFGGLNSGSFASWGWKPKTTEENVLDTSMVVRRMARMSTLTGNNLLGAAEADASSGSSSGLYIFKYNPTLTFHVKEGGEKKLGTQMDPVGFTVRNELEGLFQDNFRDGQGGAYEKNAIFTENDVAKANLSKIHTVSDGYAADAKPGTYKIKLVYGDTGNPLMEDTQIAVGYKNKLDFSAVLMVPENTTNPPTPGPLSSDPENNPLDPAEKPQIDPLSTSNLNGSASYTTNMAQGASADRVLGLQSAELPFFNKKNGLVKLYGTYDVTVDPDKVKMEPTAKVLPEPEQEQARAQYREYDKELTTAAGTAKFRLTYNGTTLDIYPTDEASMAILTAGDGTKNVEVESQALFAAFKEMGITLDDLDGVYTHFEELKDYSFRS